jgi:CheY-like chemotaxis protein
LYDAGHSLLALIDDILDLSKVEAGKLELEHVPLNLRSLVDSAAAVVRPTLSARNLSLAVELAPDLPAWIEGDPTRLRQVLLNLLSNAGKFTEQGGVIVGVLREPARQNRLRFEVRDTGIGIPPEQHHLLFREFSQIDRSTTRRFGGTGLGLAICKRLIEAMPGGEVGLESEAGRGCTFWFTIDFQPVAPAETAVRPTSRSEIGATAPAARILVAEDLVMNQLVVQYMLEDAGHAVVVAHNGVEALDAVQAGSFDLVLMDVEMPQMDGLTATERIRALPGNARHIPIIALTANAMMEQVAKCRAAGMDDYLTKPINRADLMRKVAEWSRLGATGCEAHALKEGGGLRPLAP